MSFKKFIPYGRQSIDKIDIENVCSALSEDIITRGKTVEKFETETANYCGAKYAVAFNSGTTALHAAYYAAKTSYNDQIISTGNTFVATVNAGMHYSKRPPLFVDIDKDTGNIDLKKLDNVLHNSPSRGKNIIVPTHFSGIPVDMARLESLILKPDTVIIEDAAHALGSSYYKGGPKVGSCKYSHMTILSFHPVKTITTGEGGMVLTNDEATLQRLGLFRNNGIEYKRETFPWYYEVQDTTGNFNFTDFQAALGLSQLKKLDKFTKSRRKLVGRYRRELANIPHIRLFSSSFDSHTCYHIFVVRIDFSAYNTTREHIMKHLKEKNIGTQVHYIPLYHHPIFTNISGDISEQFPNTEDYYSQTLTLPLYYGLEEKDVIKICDTLKKLLN